ncbi:uncharacterized protein KY384_007670 [Bacidia gigantensis]|uniref:uncharacterized protein n=1 Tax=Bacidia gigantensis TaxID=2732470 RepID=UPI001D053180|nr:uncharacterized protein KY384_007670 [Bacidia gigantensis]KAG8527518.1 hypothetical protein KY384_007670 [Bacidia gigantensis]
MRSPVSPFDDPAKHSFESRRNCAYPTPHPEPSSMAESARGLGIYDCSMPHQQSSVQALPPSPQQSESWSHSSMVEQDPYLQTTQPPNILTAAYDPFSEYPSNSHMISAASEEAPGLVYCPTPPSTNMPSHRSSVSSSCSPPHQHAEYYGSRVKAEESAWYPSPDNDQVLQRSLPTQSFSPYSNGVTAIHGSTEDLYKSPTGDWAKVASAPYPMELHTENLMSDEIRPRFDSAPVLPSVNRIKKKRQRTTPEEATHECRVCGKLFKRSYNWKSHMETHNPDRKYPHPCTADVNGQRCSKKFQRKTDLDRHYDSVHLKAKNHCCNLCGNRFARRDTLRRHTEDGCPKRFEVGLRESAPPVTRWPVPNYPRERTYSLNGNGMLPPMPHPASAHAPQPSFFHRQPDFVSSPLQTTTTHSIFAQ